MKGRRPDTLLSLLKHAYTHLLSFAEPSLGEDGRFVGGHCRLCHSYQQHTPGCLLRRIEKILFPKKKGDQE